MINWSYVTSMLLLAIAVASITITGCMIGDEFLHAGPVGIYASGVLAAILWINSMYLWAGGSD